MYSTTLEIPCAATVAFEAALASAEDIYAEQVAYQNGELEERRARKFSGGRPMLEDLSANPGQAGRSRRREQFLTQGARVHPYSFELAGGATMAAEETYRRYGIACLAFVAIDFGLSVWQTSSTWAFMSANTGLALMTILGFIWRICFLAAGIGMYRVRIWGARLAIICAIWALVEIAISLPARAAWLLSLLTPDDTSRHHTFDNASMAISTLWLVVQVTLFISLLYYLNSESAREVRANLE